MGRRPTVTDDEVLHLREGNAEIRATLAVCRRSVDAHEIRCPLCGEYVGTVVMQAYRKPHRADCPFVRFAPEADSA